MEFPPFFCVLLLPWSGKKEKCEWEKISELFSFFCMYLACRPQIIKPLTRRHTKNAIKFHHILTLKRSGIFFLSFLLYVLSWLSLFPKAEKTATLRGSWDKHRREEKKTFTWRSEHTLSSKKKREGKYFMPWNFPRFLFFSHWRRWEEGEVWSRKCELWKEIHAMTHFMTFWIIKRHSKQLFSVCCASTRVEREIFA